MSLVDLYNSSGFFKNEVFNYYLYVLNLSLNLENVEYFRIFYKIEWNWDINDYVNNLYFYLFFFDINILYFNYDFTDWFVFFFFLDFLCSVNNTMLFYQYFGGNEFFWSLKYEFFISSIYDLNSFFFIDNLIFFNKFPLLKFNKVFIDFYSFFLNFKFFFFEFRIIFIFFVFLFFYFFYKIFCLFFFIIFLKLNL